MGLREIFFPPKRDFVKMLKEQAEKTAEGMQALQEFVADPTPERDKKVVRLEEEADEMRRLLIECQRKSSGDRCYRLYVRRLQRRAQRDPDRIRSCRNLV